MGLRHCSVPGCFNSKVGGWKTFYAITAKHRDSDAWKRFCGDMSLSDHCLVCEDHFLDEDFKNPANKSQGLNKYAVPRIKSVNERTNNNHTPKVAPVSSTLESSDTECRVEIDGHVFTIKMLTKE